MRVVPVLIALLNVVRVDSPSRFGGIARFRGVHHCLSAAEEVAGAVGAARGHSAADSGGPPAPQSAMPRSCSSGSLGHLSAFQPIRLPG